MALFGQANKVEPAEKEEKKGSRIGASFRKFSNNQFLILAIIVIMLGAAARLWNLTAFSSFSASEMIWLNKASVLISGHYAFNSQIASSPLFVYYLALLKNISHGNPLYIRLGLVIIGLLATLVYYLLTNTWFNKQVSLVATLFFATSATLCILSRAVSPVMLVLLLEFSVIYILTLAFRDKNKWLFLLAGIIGALGIFIDQLFIMSGLLIALVSFAAIAARPKIFRTYLTELAILFTPILLALVAYLYIFRSSLGAIFSTYLPGSLADFYLNLGKGLMTLFYGAQFSSVFNVAFEPLLDPLVAVTAICGIIFAVFHFSKRKHKFFIFWLGASLILFSLLATSTIEYLALSVPILLVFAALSVDYLLTSWVRTFPYDKSARLLMTAVFSIFLFLSIYYNYQKFFAGWIDSKIVAAEFTQVLK